MLDDEAEIFPQQAKKADLELGPVGHDMLGICEKTQCINKALNFQGLRSSLELDIMQYHRNAYFKSFHKCTTVLAVFSFKLKLLAADKNRKADVGWKAGR